MGYSMKKACVFCVATFVGSANGLALQQLPGPESESSKFLELSQVPVVVDGASGLAATSESVLLQESSSDTGIQGRQGRVESLLSAEQTALLSQEQALEQIAAQQAALAKQQEALKEREAKVEAEITAKLAAGSFSQLQASTAHAQSLTSGFKAQLKRIVQKSWKEQLISASVYVLIMLGVGWIYGAFFTYEYPPLRKEPLVTRQDFSFGIYDGLACDPDTRIPLCSCCCLPVRWADTAASPKVNFLSYWRGLILISLLLAFNGLTYGISGFIALVVVVTHRQKIRQVYGMPNGTFATVARDFAMWCCCIPCAAMQEAMEIEFVDPLGGTVPQMMRMDPLQKDPFLQGGRKASNPACC